MNIVSPHLMYCPFFFFPGLMYFMGIPKTIEHCHKFVNEWLIKIFYFIDTFPYFFISLTNHENVFAFTV